MPVVATVCVSWLHVRDSGAVVQCQHTRPPHFLLLFFFYRVAPMRPSARRMCVCDALVLTRLVSASPPLCFSIPVIVFCDELLALTARAGFLDSASTSAAPSTVHTRALLCCLCMARPLRSGACTAYLSVCVCVCVCVCVHA
ncbi:hypothetical protein EON67_10515 [archaeon]|nr:MAG: hypothetical protein EON67_10515 [archaeon]